MLKLFMLMLAVSLAQISFAPQAEAAKPKLGRVTNDTALYQDSVRELNVRKVSRAHLQELLQKDVAKLAALERRYYERPPLRRSYKAMKRVAKKKYRHSSRKNRR